MQLDLIISTALSVEQMIYCMSKDQYDLLSNFT